MDITKARRGKKFVGVSPEESARKDIALTEKEIANILTGVGNNIVDTTKIFTDALMEAAGDVVSFAAIKKAKDIQAESERYFAEGLISGETMRGRRTAGREVRGMSGRLSDGELAVDRRQALKDYEERITGVDEFWRIS